MDKLFCVGQERLVSLENKYNSDENIQRWFGQFVGLSFLSLPQVISGFIKIQSCNYLSFGDSALNSIKSFEYTQ